MEVIFRNYRDSDYPHCEALVNEAWSLDTNIACQPLANLAKRVYTMGAIVSSNYLHVVEVDSTVAGFIFGFNELARKPKRPIRYGLGILWRLFRTQCARPQDKKDLIKALTAHEKNRTRVVDKGRSEITLFVVGKPHKAKGYGTRLWTGFREHCRQSGVHSIIVETNKLGASSFYEQMGFTHLANFDSPLHEYGTRSGQACMYEYSLD